jgi:hypothetical protein
LGFELWTFKPWHRKHLNRPLLLPSVTPTYFQWAYGRINPSWYHRCSCHRRPIQTNCRHTSLPYTLVDNIGAWFGRRWPTAAAAKCKPNTIFVT